MNIKGLARNIEHLAWPDPNYLFGQCHEVGVLLSLMLVVSCRLVSVWIFQS